MSNYQAKIEMLNILIKVFETQDFNEPVVKVFNFVNKVIENYESMYNDPLGLKVEVYSDWVMITNLQILDPRHTPQPISLRKYAKAVPNPPVRKQKRKASRSAEINGSSHKRLKFDKSGGETRSEGAAENEAPAEPVSEFRWPEMSIRAAFEEMINERIREELGEYIDTF